QSHHDEPRRREPAQDQTVEATQTEEPERGALDRSGPGETRAHETLRPHPVVVGAADAVGVVVGKVDAHDEGPRHHQGEQRLPPHEAAGQCRGGRAHEDRGEGVGPRPGARPLEPVGDGRAGGHHVVADQLVGGEGVEGLVLAGHSPIVPPANRSAIALLSTLPPGRTGSSSTTATDDGAERSPSSPVTCARRSSADAGARRVTAATGVVPSRGSGSPTTTTSTTAACGRSASSRACGKSVSPPTLNASSSRPRIRSRPSRSICPASSVRNQPSRSKARCPGAFLYPSASCGPASQTRPSSSSTSTVTPSSGTPSYTQPPAVSLIP